MATELIPFEPARLFTVAKPLGMEGLTDRELGIDIPRLRLIHSIRSANDIGTERIVGRAASGKPIG